MRRLALLILVLALSACGSSTAPRLALLRTAPTLTGPPVVGQTLTSSTGTWTNSPTSFSYQWQRCTTSCSNIAGATASTYTVASADVGDTIDVVVTATNAGGSASQTSAPSGTVSAGAVCNLNATTANLAAQVSAAAPGQTVCLASGTYTGFVGTSKAPPGITITSAPGASVTFGAINLPMASVQNFTMDGTAGGGTMAINGQLDMETPGDAHQSKALNLTFQNIAFGPVVASPLWSGPENANVAFNRDTFVDPNTVCPASFGGQFYVYATSSPTTQTGLTIENSVFVASTDLWNPGRAVQDGAPLVFKNNVVTGYLDHTESASCTHIDGLQWFSGTNGTTGSVTFTGNLCYDNYGCAMAFDGTASNTITDNACFDEETACLNLYSDSPGSVINHNVDQHLGADPGGCQTMVEPQAPIQSCAFSQLLISSHKTGDRVTSGQTFTNNVDPSAPNVETGDLATSTANLWPGAASPNLSGTPTFAGGVNPTTWAGFELASGSAGKGAGTDGLDVGVRASAGGPPTGGGSAPLNTTAPALSGTATHGQALSTTNGAWSITGNVPTATTYQWFDCPTSTFSLGACSAIQTLNVAPVAENTPTYTLTSADVGKYVVAMVTVTNANGQVNAVSNAVGPVG